MTWLVSYIIAGLAAASQTFSPGVNFNVSNTQADAHNANIVHTQNADETDSFEATYPLNANGKVSVSNINGSITIEAWDKNEVKVKATKIADTRERLEEVKIEIDAEPDHLTINTHFMPWSKKNQSHKSGRLEVTYHITVPRGAVLDQIEAVNGSVSISGVGNVTKVSAVNGSVKATNLRGTANLSTVNGTLTAEFENLSNSNRINLTTVNGKAYLVIPSDSNATIKADTVNGLITNDFGLAVRKGKYVGRDLYGKVGDGTVKIFLESVNGPLTVNRKQDGKTLSPVTNLLPANSEDDDPDEDMDMDITVNVDSDAEAKVSGATGQGISKSEDCPKPHKDCDKVIAPIGPRAPRAARAPRAPRSVGGVTVATVPSVPTVPPVASVPSVRSVPLPVVVTVPAPAVSSQAGLQLVDLQQRQAAIKQLEDNLRKNSETISKNLEKIEQNKENAELLRQLKMQNLALENTNKNLKARLESLNKTLALLDSYYATYDSYSTYTFPGVNFAPSSQTVTNSFEVKDKPKVVVDAPETAVFVRGWDKKEVKYTLAKVSIGDARSAPVYEAKQNGSTINIVVSPQPLDRALNRSGKNIARSRIEIFVPRKADLKINTSREIRVEGVNGKIELTGSDEAVNVRDSSGELNVATADGAIRVIGFEGVVDSSTSDGLTSLEGDFKEISASTADGKIVLTLPDKINADIEANHDNIEAEGIDIEHVSENEDRCKWKIGDGGPAFRFTTSEGGKIILRSMDKLSAEK